MKQNKLPRDLVGIVFYVLGWVAGVLLKAVYYTVKFMAMALYAGSKRDQLNRRLRLALKKIESGGAQARAFGREELRHIAAGVGLTNSPWHKNVKVRRRIFDALKSAGEAAVETGDLNQIQASRWLDEVSRVLFANFDRNLLTEEDKPKQRRRLLRRNSTEKTSESFGENLSEVIAGNSARTVIAKQTASTDRTKNYDTTELVPLPSDMPPIPNIPNVPATDWANSDEESLSVEE